MRESKISFTGMPKRPFFAVFLALFLALGSESPQAQDIAPAEATPTQANGVPVAEATPPQIPASTAEPATALPAPLEVEPDFNALPQTAEGAGAETWYYEAKKLEQSVDADPKVSPSIDLMYALAFHFGEKAAAREAGKALLQQIGRASCRERV